MSPSKPYFCYDPEGDGFTLYETAEKAEKAAKTAIVASKEDGMWSEDVECICWGTVIQKVIETERHERPPDSELDEEGYDPRGYYWGREDDPDVVTEYDCIVNYGLVDAYEKGFYKAREEQ